MKNYKNPAPLEFTIEDKNGKEIILHSVIMTPNDFKKFDEIAMDEKMNAYDKAPAQLQLIFGGKVEDYVNINQLLIKQILADWRKEIETPIPESKKG